MGKFSRTWSLMGDSWRILKQDKELLVFPLLSMICCGIVLASFAIPMFAEGNYRPPDSEAPTEEQIIYYGRLFLLYFINYFLIVFFNSAVIACAAIRMEGGDPTLGDGFRASFSRLPLIFGWAFVAATVGLILRIIEDRSDKIGRIVAGLLGMVWSVISFLVVPVLVIERKGPIAALKESTSMLRKTWGEQIISGFSFGLVFFLLAIPAIVMLFLGSLSGNSTILVLTIIGAAVYLILLALIQSVLQSIFQAALYHYARSGDVPAGFEPVTLRGAIARK